MPPSLEQHPGHIGEEGERLMQIGIGKVKYSTMRPGGHRWRVNQYNVEKGRIVYASEALKVMRWLSDGRQGPPERKYVERYYNNFYHDFDNYGGWNSLDVARTVAENVEREGRLWADVLRDLADAATKLCGVHRIWDEDLGERALYTLGNWLDDIGRALVDDRA